MSMSDGERYPYVKDVMGKRLWHKRSPLDETVDTPEGTTYGTICGKEIYSAHISNVHPAVMRSQSYGASREFMCRMCQRIEHHEWLIDKMAESAHNAWWFTYRRMGFTSRKAEWGEEFMVPFEQLSERGKEFDRTIMRAILAHLFSAGISLRKRRT